MDKRKKDKRAEVSKSLLSQLYYNENIPEDKDIKQTFIEEHLKGKSVEVKESYIIYLIQASTFERLLGKDLYSFSKKDILDMFSNNYTSSSTALRALFTVSKTYSTWSIERGKNRTGINSFSLLNFKDDILTMLNMVGLENKFLSEEQVWDLQNHSPNYQDFLVVLAPFYSIKGNQCCELINMKQDSFNGVENTITLVTDTDKKTGEILSTRTIPISRKLADVIQRASGEDIYQRRGKEGFGNRTTCELFDSEYILRPTTKNGNPYITAQTCASRAKKVFQDAGMSSLSITDMYNSGKINMLQRIEKENGELTIDNYKEVQIAFADSSENYSNLKDMYSLYKTAISKAE